MTSLRSLLVPGVLVALAAVPVVAGLVRLSGLLLGQASADDARFFEQPVPITLHLLSVIPYSLLGALQFAPALRRHRWHRAAGALLVPLGLGTAVTGLWMAQAYPWPAGDGEAVYIMRLVVGTAMTLSIVKGTAALWHHEYTTHGAWMLRGYALGMGAGTQVLTHLPWFILVDGRPDETSRALMMGLGWIVNAVVAESIIHRRLTGFATVASRGQRGTPGSRFHGVHP